MAQASTADARTDPRQAHQSLANHVDAARLRLDVRFCARVTVAALLPYSANSDGESVRFEIAQVGFLPKLKAWRGGKNQAFTSASIRISGVPTA